MYVNAMYGHQNASQTHNIKVGNKILWKWGKVRIYVKDRSGNCIQEKL